ncbi:MAG: hypothetical protein HY726_21800 [Candidatus Rokubacteria bacterium]|nr:hypothetical protein [Candidatus Rokubacteria bacterium]
MILDATHTRWLVICLVILAGATIAYVPYHQASVNGPSGGSWPGLAYGIAGFALMVYAGVLGARRKVPTWRLGRGSTWMRGHIWFGLLSLPLVLFHSGFEFGGALTQVLMWLFIAVVASGIFGLLVQQFLPRVMMVQVPLETIYEEIDSVVLQLQAEADEVAAAVCGPLPVTAPGAPLARRGGGGLHAGQVTPRPTPRPRPPSAGPAAGSALLKDAYLRDIRAFLDRKLPRDGRLATPVKTTVLFQHLRTALPPSLHETVNELEAICEERRQLAQQKRLHHWLHGWLLVHVPLSMALLLLSAVHAVTALRY